jgi:hypothetical protein
VTTRMHCVAGLTDVHTALVRTRPYGAPQLWGFFFLWLNGPGAVGRQAGVLT